MPTPTPTPAPDLNSQLIAAHQVSLKKILSLEMGPVMGLKAMAATKDQDHPIAVGFIPRDLVLKKDSHDAFPPEVNQLKYTKLEIEIALTFTEEIRLDKALENIEAATRSQLAIEFVAPQDIPYLEAVKNNGFCQGILTMELEDPEFQKSYFAFQDDSGKQLTEPGSIEVLKGDSPYSVGKEMLGILAKTGGFEVIPQGFVLLTGSLIKPMEVEKLGGIEQLKIIRL